MNITPNCAIISQQLQTSPSFGNKVKNAKNAKNGVNKLIPAAVFAVPAGTVLAMQNGKVKADSFNGVLKKYYQRFNISNGSIIQSKIYK